MGNWTLMKPQKKRIFLLNSNTHLQWMKASTQNSTLKCLTADSSSLTHCQFQQNVDLIHKQWFTHVELNSIPKKVISFYWKNILENNKHFWIHWDLVAKESKIMFYIEIFQKGHILINEIFFFFAGNVNILLLVFILMPFCSIYVVYPSRLFAVCKWQGIFLGHTKTS